MSFTIIGQKDKDDFFIKYSNGVIIKWPSIEEMEALYAKYPLPSIEELMDLEAINS